MEERAESQAEKGVVHVVVPREDAAAHRKAARQRTFALRCGGPPLIRSREAARSQKWRESLSTGSAPTARLPTQYRDQKPSKSRLHPTQPPQQKPRMRLRRKSTPETPEERRMRLTRDRVRKCRGKKEKPEPRVKKTRRELHQAALVRKNRHRAKKLLEAATKALEVPERAE